MVVLVPTEACARAKGVDDARDGAQRGGGHLECAGHERGTAFLRERERLLRIEAEQRRRRVVVDVAARGLRGEPLLHVARVGAGVLRERCGGGRRLRERLVEPELVADHHHAGMQRRPEIADEAAEERIELAGVGRHGRLLWGLRAALYWCGSPASDIRNPA